MKRSRIGPDRIYPPISQIDAFDAAFSIAHAFRYGIMEFGSMRQWVCAPPFEMRQLARLLRGKCIKAFGVLPYDKSDLPVRVYANREKGVIELHLEEPCEKLAANPEMWLALAEAIDTTAATMRT